jgi:hypothetical protein
MGIVGWCCKGFADVGSRCRRSVRSCEWYITDYPCEVGFPFFSFGVSYCFATFALQRVTAMYTVGNVYIIAAVAVIGGGLFGFDISSMSAIIGMSR